MRRPLVVGNWKMNGNAAGNQALLDGVCAAWQGVHQVEVAVCPPYVYLSAVANQLEKTNIGVGAQDVSSREEGAFTGEVSSTMLADIQCQYVVVGHSERREYFAESDELVARKFERAQSAGLTHILCVGETLQERDSGDALLVIGEQLKVVVDHCGRDSFRKAVVAYEPVWAIGTGRTASPEQAQEVHQFIREQLGQVGQQIRILYGGSVKPDNASELFSQPDIDGALVGGASLKADDFLAICRAAE